MSNITDRIANLSPEQRVKLLRQLREKQGNGASSVIEPQSRLLSHFPLSFAQQRLWFIEQLQPGLATYNMSHALHLSGSTNIAAVKASFRHIIERHEVLRTTFALVDDQPMQIIAPELRLDIPLIDLSNLESSIREDVTATLIHDEALCPFDLEQGPLLRVNLIRLDQQQHILILSQHHIVTDAWSLDILSREFTAFYDGLRKHQVVELPPLPIQYADYAVWQRQWLQGSTLERYLNYWREQLQGAPQLDMPTDYPRPAVQTHRGEIVSFRFGEALTAQLTALSQKAGTTLFVTLMAAWQALLARYSGQDDIMIGMGIAGRMRKEVEDLLGFFVNTLVIRTQLTGDSTGLELLARARAVIYDAYTYQDLPFEYLVEHLQPERDLSRHPLVQIMLVLQNTRMAKTSLSGVDLSTDFAPTNTANFDISLSIAEYADDLWGSIEFAADLFETTTISRLCVHFRQLLTDLVTAPTQRLSELSLLSEAERQTILVDWNATTQAVTRQQMVPVLFERQVDQRPDAIAVIADTYEVSYSSLDVYANQLAHQLRSYGVTQEIPVVVFMERCPDLIVALLAVLKVGGAYVPVDPTYPPERVAFMIQDTQTPVVLTQSGLAHTLASHLQARVVCLDQVVLTPTSVRLDLPASPQQAAYVIYTSGSTGTPKGVTVSHASLCNLVSWHQRAYEVDATDRATLMAGLAFDAAVWEIWPYLLAGACIALPDDMTRVTVEPLLTWLAAEQTTIAFFPTPLAEAMLAYEDWPADVALRMLLTGGDVLHRWPDPSLPFTVVNNYGPTENTVVTTWLPLTAPNTFGLPPIGRPVDNAQVYVVDQYMSPAPLGVPGELYIGGASLARGYFLRPELTAERFLPDPFSGTLGARLYRTGDLVCYQSTGNIEFLGRIDHQVKLRGYRIELGEIEATLHQHPAIQDTVVLAREDLPGDKRLVAYLVPTTKHADNDDANGTHTDEHVAHWQNLYDETYEDTTPIALEDPTFNIIGWNSSYTNAPLPAEEMREWVDTTVARIVAHRPQHVLEIGCGTGLLLFPLAQQCTKYVGVDFSATAIDYIKRHLDPECDHVTLYQRRADDLPDLGQQQFDTVILNSIIQYFPSIEYLLTVIEQAIPYIAPGGQLFIGDVRNLPLLELFITATQTQQAAPGLPLARLHQRVRQQVAMERELVIDPAFFYVLPQRFPQISNVRVELKRGAAHNELTQFRYDATMIVNGPSPSIATEPVHDWNADEWTMDRVLTILREKTPTYLQLQRVPNSRLSRALQNRYLLNDAAGPTSVRTLQEAIAVHGSTGVNPEQFWCAAETTGYSVTITWSPQNSDGSYDVLFYPTTETNVSFGVSDTIIEWSHYANRPAWDASQHDLIPQLRQYLATQLPEYMVPSAYLILTTLPLTRNGKVDRRALPAPDQIDSGQYVAPKIPLEVDLVTIWEEVLGITRIGVTDDFFILGGHSLLATQIVSRIRTVCDVDLPVRVLFEHPTIAQLAQTIQETQRSSKTVMLPPLMSVSRTTPIPLSFAQQRLWFIDQLQPGMAAYHFFAGLQLQGELHIAALIASFQDIVQRHESLRTTFTVVDDQPVQVITPILILDVPLVDASGLSREHGETLIRTLAQREALRPFDLTQGPLLRIMLIQVAPQECVILVNQHHIVTDGWSLGIFIRELTTLYASKIKQGQSPLPPLPIQYPDYAAWQHSWLHGEVLAHQMAYWRQQLAEQQLLQLPTDYPRPPMPSYRGNSVPIVFEEAFVERLQSLSRQSGTTLFMTTLAGWQALLTRYSGQDDIVVGSPIAGRTHAALEHLIGFFVNTLVLRTNLHGNPSGGEMLRRVQSVTLDAYAHQDMPFEYLVAELQPQRDLSRQPLYQVVFALQNMPTAALDLSDIQISPLNVGTMTTQVDLTLHLAEVGTHVVGRLEYAVDLFEHATIERYVQHYHTLLQGLIENPACRLFDLPLLTDAEQTQLLVEWQHPPAVVAPPLTIPEWFTAQVAQRPDAIAIVCEDQLLSYQELDTRANQLAHYLQMLGVGPDICVALWFDRSIEMLIAILGVLKAGGAYLPMDRSHPADRLALMIRDADVSTILTQEALRAQLPATDVQIVCVDMAADVLRAQPATPPPAACNASHLAYVIYTSGSTGTPKGVLIAHAQVSRLLTATDHWFHFTATDTWTMFHSYAFDFSVWEIWGALLYGGRLVIVPYEDSRDPALFAHLVAQQQVTILNQTPSAFREFMHATGDISDQVLSLRAIIFGGEALDPQHLQQWLTRNGETMPQLINMYGITETTVHVTYRPITQVDCTRTSRSIIGNAIPDLQTYVLDQYKNLMPVGIPGELYVGGAGLARGYLHRPGLTAERFVPNPLSGQVGNRLYRTGDSVRCMASGELEYLGRVDQQVKVRGFRIELGEIEAVLRQHHAVQDAVVIVRQDWDETPLIAGYLVSRTDHEIAMHEIRAYIYTKVPPYMVPSVLMQLDSLPMTQNGKLDRQALPLPSGSLRVSNMPFVAPRTPTEDVVASIWARLLNQSQVGIHDDFFDLGGHSLLATRVIAQIRDVFGVELPVRAVFETPILWEFAQQVVAAQRTHTTRVAPPLVAQPRSGADLPVSFAQQRLWFVQHLEPLSIAYHMPNILRLRGALNLGVLVASWRDVVVRHESLRTVFPEVDAQPVQRITPPGSVSVPCIDLRGLEGNLREHVAREHIQIFIQQPFDLAHGPLLRAALWQLNVDETVLVFILHHIVGDGWSQGILVSDLAAFYTSRLQGSAPALVPLPIQYADYAIWQRQWLHGDVLASQVAYWRRQLADLPTLQLPTDYPRPAVPSYRGADLRVLLEPELTSQVRALAQQANGTLFMVVLAAWQLLLARYSGQDDIVVGMGIAGRTHVETDALIGFFVNTLVLRTDVGGQPTGWEVLERVRTVTLNAYAHQDVPFEEVVAQVQPERNLSRQPLFQVLIVLQNTPRPTADVSSVQIMPMAIENQTAKFDMTLDLTETPLGILGRIEYGTDLYEAATVERLWGHYRTLLTGLVTQTTCASTALPMLSSTERHQLLVDWNRTSQSVAPAVGIHTLVLQQATQTPDRIALSAGEYQLSYAMLVQQAIHHAHHLRHLGVGDEVRVGLFLDRSLDMVVATLAVLLTGGVYVPLDPDYPPERLAFLLQDANVAVVLTQAHLRAQLPEAPCAVHCMVSGTERSQATSDHGLLISAYRPEQLAYVMYTSGSTGVPKGVSVPHHAINRLVSAPNYVTLAPDDVFLQLAPTAFDAATLEIWAPLVHGARLVLAPAGQRSLSDITTLLQQHQVQVLWLTAGLFHLMVEHHGDQLATVGQVLAGGDALSVPHVQQLHAAGGQVINGYGPTENTTFTCCYRVPNDRVLEGSVPIGYPINQTQVYILDRDGQPVPIGVPGELYAGGDGLARGYLDRPALTAERFVPHPFSSVLGARLYRTGDRVRYRVDGAIEFLGRVDHQIKLRGFRIELGEIEAVLQQHPLVQTGVVLLHEDGLGDKRLTAYVVPGFGDQGGTTYGELVGDHIDQWQTLYEETYDEVAPVASDDPTFNIIGWNSSYTNAPIPAEEMATWVDTTVARIAAGNPQRILEIGCGTGLLLFRLAGQCAQYVGSDFSAAALDYVRQHLDPTWDHVTLQQQRADDFSAFGDQQFDVIVLNSIVQYFPSADYLLRVLEGALRLVAPGGRIFVGDVRNLALLDAFATAVACYQAGSHTGRHQLWQQVQQLLIQERELLLDPHFFVALAKRFPQISNVHIEVKRGWTHNELSQFRYDVTLTVAGMSAELIPVEAHDWFAEAWTLDRVRDVITQAHPAWLYLTQVPNQRVRAAVQGVAHLADPAGPTTAEALRETLAAVSGIEPEAFWQLGEECGYAVSVSWSPDTPGCCEVLFRLSTADAVVTSIQKGWMSRLSCEEYANQPIWDSTQRSLAPMLQEYVTTQLPEYMVPSSVMVLARLPLTPNGKLDRAALPEPNQGMLRTGELVAPRTDVEKGLITIWQSVLGIEQIGITDNFFELGGHSLLATQVISRIRTQYRIDLPVRALFESPTVAQLAPVVATTQRTTQLATLPSLQPMPRDHAIPLSFAQQRLWFIEQLHPGTAAYHVYAGLRLQGPLSVKALTDSLQTIVARHESLRTTFTVLDDQPVQLIHAHVAMQLPFIDLSAQDQDAQELIVQELALRETYRPFNMVAGPLIRGYLLRLHTHEHVLLLNQHHIITDGWSLSVLVSELTSLYAQYLDGPEPTLPPLPIQYPDYAMWQHTWLQGDVLTQQLAYWRTQLAQLTTLQMPTDYPRPPMPTYRGMNTFFMVDELLLNQLQTLSQQTGTTLFMTILAGWQVLLARYSGQDDIVVGSPIAGRTQTELEQLIGFFVNTLVLRTNLAGNPTVWDALARVQTVTLDAYAHQDIPFEYLVAELQPQRDLSRQPLFQVSFALQNMPQGTLQLSDLIIQMEPSHLQIAQFDLSLHVQEAAEGLFGRLEYAVDLFEHTTMERLLQHYQMVLTGFVQEPTRCLSDVSLLTESERTQLAQWNNTTRVYPQDTDLRALLVAQAQHTPDRIALRSTEGLLTFGMLHQRASCLAAYLQHHGVGPDIPVAVCVERSLDLLISLVGVLYAGGAYIPLDPDYPTDRLTFLLSDAAASLILTQAALLERLQDSLNINAQLIALDTDWESIQQIIPVTTPTVLTPAHLAYVIYTSGSTGRPKGAMNTHQAIVNRLLWMQDAYTLGEADRVVQKTPYSFDVSVWELFWPLITGASLVVAAPGGHQDPLYLGDLIEREYVTILHFVPSMLQAFLESVAPGKLDAVRDVVCSGEALSLRLQERFFAYTQTRLHNLYGPTEAAVDVTTWQCLPQSNRVSVPIGRPIANTQLHVVGRSGEQMPIGVLGELLIGGVQLARGYYRRPGLTAERFIPDPFGGRVGSRVYRTGDLARYRVDGAIEYIGRLDHQVKLRGFRIELGEIEAVLHEHPDIQDAVVLVRNERSEAPLIVGYVVPFTDRVVEASALREYVHTQVPHYMVPGVLMLLDCLPLTPNGKVDRAALPSPVADRSRATAAYEAPQTAIEQHLALIWQEVLEMDQVGIDDNFFELGGHSLLLTQVHRRVREQVAPDLLLVDLFRYPTIAALAKAITQTVDHQQSLEQSRTRATVRAARTQQRRQQRQRNRSKDHETDA
ncbi:MAG: hypothetical protein GFH27_549391n2 [Chloroflexi bacterium AL-W]|nr:hypothetical protein [Chloroflexi bacterium AL-N1]NOK71315.1 hypothetical protein [Chloroflexi bacterium AL-N10]NOK78661.1 hypothetical protein [Chloroflexi bacterium AL-N5]NOK85957.1 hypothetical protein [Chloroflexi bacterium AL-W]NOK93040.1 hypothetical protein [Chloroflexi bacterium AL-N15]